MRYLVAVILCVIGGMAYIAGTGFLIASAFFIVASIIAVWKFIPEDYDISDENPNEVSIEHDFKSVIVEEPPAE